MAKRMPSGRFVAELEAALDRGDGYIMASYGQNPRTGHLDLSRTDCKPGWKKDGWYFTQYDANPRQKAQALKWREKCTRVWDCNGMAEGIYEMYTGVCVNQRAADNYAGWCGVRGRGLIPAAYRVPGAAVFWGPDAGSIHHVAYLYKPVAAGRPEGDWYLIEARSVMYGVVRTKLFSRNPDYWGLMDKYFDYSSGRPESAPAGDAVEYAGLPGSRILRNGCEGADVKEMQSGLIRLGFGCGKWGADGEFGGATERAVRLFQGANGLEVDGEFGPATLAAFEEALRKLNVPADDPRAVGIEGGQCYIRSAPNTTGKILGVAPEGSELPFGGVIDGETRWLSVVYKGATGWVSGRYGRLKG